MQGEIWRDANRNNVNKLKFLSFSLDDKLKFIDLIIYTFRSPIMIVSKK